MEGSGDQVSRNENAPENGETIDPEVERFFLSIGRSRLVEKGTPLVDLSWTRAFTYEHLLNQTYRTVINHPSSYMRTLVQLGYEPLPGRVNWNFFGQTRLYFPNFFTYTRHIAQVDGWWGLYRGLGYNLMYSLIYDFVYRNVQNMQEHVSFPWLKDVLQEPECQFDSCVNLMLGVTTDTAPRLVALLLAYPFKVMMVRCMAQFIGRETVYDSVWSAMCDLYRSGGVTAFYAGLVPFVLAEFVCTYSRYLVFFGLRNKTNQPTRSLVDFATAHLVSYGGYSLQLVSTIMCCNGANAASLVASTCTSFHFQNWLHCLQVLWHQGEYDRGFYLFWRSRPYIEDAAKKQL